MNLMQYLKDRRWEHVEEHVYINDVKQPLLPDDAVQFPLDQLSADTDPQTVYELAKATYGEFEGPVEFYILSFPDGSTYEYLTVAMHVFERARKPYSKRAVWLSILATVALVGGVSFLAFRGKP